MKKYLNHIYYVFSKKLLLNSNKYSQFRNINRFRILLLYIAFGFGVITVFTIQDFFEADFKHVQLIDIPAFILLPGMLIYLLFSKNVKLVSHLFTIFLALVILTIFFTGAGYLTAPVYYIIFPSIAMFLLGSRLGIIYSVILLSLLVLSYLIFNVYPWFPEYELQVFFRYFIILLMVTCATLLYENMIQRYHDSNVKLITRIKGQNQKLNSKTKELKITNDKLIHANQELERISKETEDLNRSLNGLITTKDKFFSIISHDLKNPINTLDGFANLLHDRYELYDEEKRRKYIRIMQESSTSLKNLIEGLLEWSRIQSGSFKYQPDKINLYQLMDLVMDSGRSQALQKEISIKNEIDEYTFIFADFQMMFSVFRNLVSNAIKYSNLCGEVRVSAQEENDFIKILIKDTGVGISNENINKLFNIDTSFSTHGTSNETGTGLGLVLCKEFVLKNNGQIGVSSTPGIGSTFWVMIPKKI